MTSLRRTAGTKSTRTTADAEGSVYQPDNVHVVLGSPTVSQIQNITTQSQYAAYKLHILSVCVCVCVCVCERERGREKKTRDKLKRNGDISLKGEKREKWGKKGTKKKSGDEEEKEKCRKGFCNLGIVVLCRLHGDRHKGPWLAIDG